MKRTFQMVHYKDMWSPYEKCKEIIKKEWMESCCWNSGNPVELFKKSKSSLAKLKIWSRNELEGKNRKLEQLSSKLNELKNGYSHFDDGTEVRTIENQIDNILLDEEIFWKQRSRADWLKEGDKNTRFFHLKASVRRKRNRIYGLEDEKGIWVEEAEKVEQVIGEHFTKMFTTTNPSSTQISVVLSELPVKITEEMASYLEQPFTAEEIADALAQMCPTKAPGPDGFPAAFYQKHWSSVKEVVVKTCLHILNEGGYLAPINHTYIALIPKVQKPRKANEFRPVSLCNVIYRIIAKTMANRLKHILNDNISPTQGAFVPNRLITDNIIIGYECLNKIRQSRSKRKGLVALKLDINKVYDRVEWSFVKCTMQKLGFSEK